MAPPVHGPLQKVEEWPDGSGRWWGTCPVCGTRAQLDQEQMAGEVSVICPSEDCSYHETHDHRRDDAD